MFKLALALMLAFALKRESQRVTVERASADAEDCTHAGVGDGADDDGALLAQALILALALALALALMLVLALALALALMLAPIERRRW